TPPTTVVAMQDSRARPAAVDELRSSMDARQATLSAPSGEGAAKTGADVNAVSETAAGSLAGGVRSSQSVGQPAPANAADAFTERALAAYAAPAPAGGSSLGAASADDAARRDASGLAGRVVPVLFDRGFGLVVSSGPRFVFADKTGRRVALFVADAPE